MKILPDAWLSYIQDMIRQFSGQDPSPPEKTKRLLSIADRSADQSPVSYQDAKVLSIRQPWAWLIVSGHKNIENRTWNTDYRGPLLIHAGQTLAPGFRELCEGITESGYDLPDTWHRGGIIGKVELVDVITKPGKYRDWFDGPYGFVLANPVPLPFMPMKGKLKLFTASYTSQLGD